MFQFSLEPDIGLLTVTRTGYWSLGTVAAYEAALRPALAKLQDSGRPTAFIIDIRSSGAQARNVADALRHMVSGLGALHADRTAVVASSGIAKLEARRVADVTAQIFTSMVLARDWVTGRAHCAPSLAIVHEKPSEAEAEGLAVHVHGPSDIDVMLTPAAALVTAKRIGDAATEALLESARIYSAKTTAAAVR